MRLLLLVVVFTLLGVCFAAKTPWHGLKEYDFEKYLAEFKKEYYGAEYTQRKTIFDSNLARIRAHNADPFSSYKMGVNHLTDLSPEEFRKLLGYKRIPHTPKYLSEHVPKSNGKIANAAPGSVDWRDKGIISDVKDQGECGSCWTFGTAETIESYYAMATGELHVFSEQQILDCTPNPNDCGGTGGCGGGITDIAYEKIIEIGGLASEWTYPYTSYFAQAFKCKNLTSYYYTAKLKSYVKLPANQYKPILDALTNTGPLAINVDASDWQNYETGVFTGCNKNNSDIDHVVQLVGYGTDSKYGDYWLIRNSWSPAWGDDGYIRIERSSDGSPCVPDTKPQDGTGCNGGPSVVTVCGACGILYDASYPVIAAH